MEIRRQQTIRGPLGDESEQFDHCCITIRRFVARPRAFPDRGPKDGTTDYTDDTDKLDGKTGYMSKGGPHGWQGPLSDKPGTDKRRLDFASRFAWQLIRGIALPSVGIILIWLRPKAALVNPEPSVTAGHDQQPTTDN
jgi:hypothetical protein